MSANPEPIFIVGIPRSGTTLLAALISSHNKISCGPETHFFSKTRKEDREKAVSDESWPNQAMELLTSLTLAGQYVYQLFNITKKQLYDYLSSRTPSEQAMLESFTHQLAINENKIGWAEKTPNHLLNIEDITRLYPKASIIHIVRDPRDASRSLNDLSWTSNSSVANSYLWYKWYNIATDYLSNDNILTIRYEDLIRYPRSVLEKVCDHTNLNFEEKMLHPEKSASKVISKNEKAWKSNVYKPIDPNKAFKWKRNMNREDVQTISLICHYGIAKNDYPDGITPQKSIKAYGLSEKTAENIDDEIREFSRERTWIEPAEISELLDSQRIGEEAFIIANVGASGYKGATFYYMLLRLFFRLLWERVNGTDIIFRVPNPKNIGGKYFYIRLLKLVLGKR